MIRIGMMLALIAGCTTEPESCPAGELGCPCRADGECNAGFECADDRTCRDDESMGTDGTTTSTTTSATTEDTVTPSSDDSTTSFDPTTTTMPPTSTTDTTTDATGSTTGAPECVCGWDRGQNFYTCGDDLPPEGPKGIGQPVCPADGFAMGEPCDSVDPPLDDSGCCIAGVVLAFCLDGAIEIQPCMVTDLGCAPTSQ